MRAYVCTKCSTPCYLFAESLLDGADPDACPYRGRSHWEQIDTEDAKERIKEA